MLILKNNKCDLRKKNINVTINQVVKKQETRDESELLELLQNVK